MIKEPGQYQWTFTTFTTGVWSAAETVSQFISSLSAWQQENIHITQSDGQHITVFYRKANQ